MKLSEAPTKIVGVQIGEVALNLIRQRGPDPMLKARFALLTDKGPTGFLDLDDRFGQWSEKTMIAMKGFTEALEEDALREIFKISDENTEQVLKEGSENEPAQF